MSKSKVCLILSAFIYGFAPILAKFAYKSGANGITLTFLRTFLMLPLLFFIMIFRKVSFKLTKKELIDIILLGVVGGSFSMISLYAAYDYIPTGLATTLHFIYPLIIVITSAVVYKEKIKKIKLLAVMLVTLGMFMFVDLNNTADKIGVILAILSGIFYSFYVVYMYRSKLDEMDYIKLTFYLMIIMSIGTYIFGLTTDSLVFEKMDYKAWILSVAISLIITLGAVPLFQVGVRCEGASTAGIVSAFEPITSIILGAVFLGETMGLVQYIGGGLIIIGVILTEKYD